MSDVHALDQGVAALPKTTVPGQPYGVAAEQRRSMDAVPMGAHAPPPALVGPSGTSEPVTAGLPTGPGPGPESLVSSRDSGELTSATLRAIYRQFPSPTIRRMIEDLGRQGR